MKKTELKKIINEELLKETELMKLISKVSKECEWDYNKVTDFIFDLLTDINFHTEAKKVKTFMQKI